MKFPIDFFQNAEEEPIMKSIVAILAVGFALSMCNLTSRVGNKNTNRPMDAETPIPSYTAPPPPPPPNLSQNSNAKTIHAPISGGVLNGKALSMPKPPYPPIAKAAHASGTVNVQVLVDEEGRVISAHAVSGHPLLQAAAVAAARQARFSPTKLSGQPVKITGVLMYNFVAQ